MREGSNEQEFESLRDVFADCDDVEIDFLMFPKCDDVLEKLRVLHLFISAPNAFIFHLGQLGRWFGRVQMYEYPFGGEERGRYMPSIRFPFEGRGS